MRAGIVDDVFDCAFGRVGFGWAFDDTCEVESVLEADVWVFSIEGFDDGLREGF